MQSQIKDLLEQKNVTKKELNIFVELFYSLKDKMGGLRELTNGQMQGEDSVYSKIEPSEQRTHKKCLIALRFRKAVITVLAANRLKHMKSKEVISERTVYEIEQVLGKNTALKNNELKFIRQNTKESYIMSKSTGRTLISFLKEGLDEIKRKYISLKYAIPGIESLDVIFYKSRSLIEIINKAIRRINIDVSVRTQIEFLKENEAAIINQLKITKQALKEIQEKSFQTKTNKMITMEAHEEIKAKLQAELKILKAKLVILTYIK